MSLHEVADTMSAKRSRNRGIDLFRSKVKAVSLFEENLVPAGDKSFTFKPGWNDGRVAKEAGAPLHVIRHLRLTMFGTVTRGRPNSPRTSALAAKVEALTAQVDGLTKQVEGLKARLDFRTGL